MEFYIGQIINLSFPWAPQGTLACEGQTLDINGHQALYSLIGNKFGGDYQKTFKLPDLRVNGQWPHEMVTVIVLDGCYPTRP